MVSYSSAGDTVSLSLNNRVRLLFGCGFLLFSTGYSQSKPHQESESTFGVVSYSSAGDTVSISLINRVSLLLGWLSYSSAGDTVSLSLINRVNLINRVRLLFGGGILLFSTGYSQYKPHQQSESTFGLVSYSSAGDTVSLSLINRVSLLLGWCLTPQQGIQ